MIKMHPKSPGVQEQLLMNHFGMIVRANNAGERREYIVASRRKLYDEVDGKGRR